MTAVANPHSAAPRMIVVAVVPIGGKLAEIVQVTGADRPNGTVPRAHYLSPGVTRRLLGALAPVNLPGGLRTGSRTGCLTSRERQVVDRISEGLSNKQIATRLGIAIHTVKSHVHNILAKLEVDNRVQVAVFGRSGEHVGWGPELLES